MRADQLEKRGTEDRQCLHTNTIVFKEDYIYEKEDTELL